MPSDGIKAKVRFTGYRSLRLNSNEGEGFVLDQDIEASRLDPLSRDIPQPIAEALDPEYFERNTPPITIGKQVAAFRLLQVCGGNLFYKNAAENLAKKWQTDHEASTEKSTAAIVIQGLTLSRWPSESNWQALFTRCVAALQNQQADASKFGMPEQYQSMVWGVLASLAESGLSRDAARQPGQAIDPKQWKSVLTLIPAAFKSSDLLEVNAATRIVAVGPLVDELLPDAFFELHLHDENEWVQRACAKTLSRRMQWKKLAEIGSEMSAKSQVIVLRALAHPELGMTNGSERTRGPELDGEERFWSHCLRTMPLESANALYLGYASEYNPYDRIVHDPLHDYFADEANKIGDVSEDFELKQEPYVGRLAVELLDSWHMEEDTPVLQQLLEYRGYVKEHSWRGGENTSGQGREYDSRIYVIRAAAKAALLRRGIPVEQDLVLKVDVPE